MMETYLELFKPVEGIVDCNIERGVDLRGYYKIGVRLNNAYCITEGNIRKPIKMSHRNTCQFSRGSTDSGSKSGYITIYYRVYRYGGENWIREEILDGCYSRRLRD